MDQTGINIVLSNAVIGLENSWKVTGAKMWAKNQRSLCVAGEVSGTFRLAHSEKALSNEKPCSVRVPGERSFHFVLYVEKLANEKALQLSMAVKSFRLWCHFAD